MPLKISSSSPVGSKHSTKEEQQPSYILGESSFKAIVGILILCYSPLLDIDDLGDVLDEVKTLSAKWRVLSTYLHLREDSLEVIEQNNPRDAISCLRQALAEWLKYNYNCEKYGKPSWRSLARAVQSLDQSLCEKIISDHQGERTHVHVAKSYNLLFSN